MRFHTRETVVGPRSTVDDAVRGETRSGGRRAGGLERARAALIDLIDCIEFDFSINRDGGARVAFVDRCARAVAVVTAARVDG